MQIMSFMKEMLPGGTGKEAGEEDMHRFLFRQHVMEGKRYTMN